MRFCSFKKGYLMKNAREKDDRNLILNDRNLLLQTGLNGSIIKSRKRKERK